MNELSLLTSIPQESETSEVLQFQSGDDVTMESASNKPYAIFDDEVLDKTCRLQTQSRKSRQGKKKLSSFLQLNNLQHISPIHKEKRKSLQLNSRLANKMFFKRKNEEQMAGDKKPRHFSASSDDHFQA